MSIPSENNYWPIMEPSAYDVDSSEELETDAQWATMLDQQREADEAHARWIEEEEEVRRYERAMRDDDDSSDSGAYYINYDDGAGLYPEPWEVEDARREMLDEVADVRTAPMMQ